MGSVSLRVKKYQSRAPPIRPSYSSADAPEPSLVSLMPIPSEFSTKSLCRGVWSMLDGFLINFWWIYPSRNAKGKYCVTKGERPRLYMLELDGKLVLTRRYWGFEDEMVTSCHEHLVGRSSRYRKREWQGGIVEFHCGWTGVGRDLALIFIWSLSPANLSCSFKYRG